MVLAEVIGFGPAGAQSSGAPTANAGPDQSITILDPALLIGKMGDDGLPDPDAVPSVAWVVLSGPGVVEFGNAREALTTATFSAVGTYVLRLTVSDGTLSSFDDVTITVTQNPPHTLRVPQDYPTIQSAVDAATTGDLVLVSPGTYTEDVYIAKTITLASTYYTTGDETLIDQTVISATDRLTTAVTFSSRALIESRIVGFTIQNGKDGVKVRGIVSAIRNRFVNVDTDAIDFGVNAAGMALNNVMENNGDDGVDVNDASVLIQGNVIRDNQGDGIEIRTLTQTGPFLTITIRDNIITNSNRDGIQLIDDDTTQATNALVIVDRNVVASNGQAGMGLMDGANTTEDFRAASLLERIHVYNNTFDDNSHGISGGDRMVVVNNIFTGHPNIAVKGIDGSSVVAHNLFWNNGTDNSGSNIDPATTMVGDPQFDAFYRLLPGSPAIDAGTALFSLPSGEVVLDLGPGDYSGASPDLGRYESDSGPSVNLPPSVDAGPDQSIELPTTSASLDGSVWDDDQPAPPALTTLWTQVSGPPGVSFDDAAAVDTTATFPGPGVYVLRLTADDSQLATADDVVVTVSDPFSASVEVRVGAGSDDAEEDPFGSISLGSSDLELVFDGGGNQVVGLRFTGVPVPAEATVTSAWVQFKADEASTEATDLTIRGQAADNPATFTAALGDISTRPVTSAQVAWSPAAWNITGEAGLNQRTPDLAPVIQEIVDRDGWVEGNALVIIVTGTGRRTAESYDGDAAGAPLLHIEYATEPPPVVSVAASDATAAEAGPDTGAFTFTRDGSMADPLTVNYAVDAASTASPADYDPLPGSVTILAGEASATVLVIPVDDGELDPDETVTVTVAPGGAYTVATSPFDTATVTITDDEMEPPPPPTNVAAAPITSTQIDLSWDVSAGLTNTSYRVERTLDGTTWTTAGTVTGANSFSDTGLTPGTLYGYQVVAINDGGESAPSAPVVEATTPPAAPDAPTAVAATPVSATAIDVTWDASAGATSYRVERSSDGGTTWSVSNSAAGSPFSDTGLTPATTYHYRVVAINAGGESAPSDVAQATTTGGGAAISFANLGSGAAPDLNETPNATSYATASWTPPTTGVVILFVESNRSGGPDTPTVSGNGLTWVQIGTTLGTGGGNGLSVFLANAAGATTGQTTISFGLNQQTHCVALFTHATGVDLSGGVAAAVLQQPTSTGTGTSGSLSFAAAAHTANRQIVAYHHLANEATTPGGAWTEFDDANGSAQSRGVATQVKADAFSFSSSASWATSSTWGAMGLELKAAGTAGPPPAPPMPQDVTADAISSTQIDVSWSASSGATGYRVERSTDGGASWATAGTPAATTFSNTGLAPATTYHYRVIATNGGGESAPSAVVQATTAAGTAAIAFVNLGASAAPDLNETPNATSYATAVWTPPTTGVVILFVEANRTGGPDTPTVTGNGLTWVQIGTTLATGGGNGLSVFLADAATATPGQTTISFGGNEQTHCVALFTHATGVDLSGGVAGAVLQQPTSTGLGTTGSLSFAAAAHTANRQIVAYHHIANEATTADGAWTAFDDVSASGQSRGVATQVKADEFSLFSSASWATSSSWGAMGLELRAAVGP